MPALRSSSFRPGDRMVLVGTMKGAFAFRGRGRSWERAQGPHFPGQPVYALAYDDRGGRVRLYASTESPFFGAALRTSDDMGRSWTDPRNRTSSSPRTPASR